MIAKAKIEAPKERPKDAPKEPSKAGADDAVRHAHGVDPDIKAANLLRLRRIEGQVRGLQRMVEEDRYCIDTLTQIASVEAALRSVSRELARNHLKHCVPKALRQGDDEANAMFEELLDALLKKGRT
jgi:DNA-binding FrmR family transcriptional regulator